MFTPYNAKGARNLAEIYIKMFGYVIQRRKNEKSDCHNGCSDRLNDGPLDQPGCSVQ